VEFGGLRQNRKHLLLNLPRHDGGWGIDAIAGVVYGGGEHLGLVAREVERVELLAQAGAVALQTIVADVIALCLQALGESPITAERAFDDKAVNFGAHRSGQHRHL
jgi:hypothetical protein